MKNYNAIMNLLHLYAERVDLGDAQGTADLFANAAIKWGAEAPVIHGSDAVLKLYQENIKLHEDGTPRTHHIITNAIIEIAEDGQTAKARSYYTVVQQTGKVPLQVIAGGRYHDVLQKDNGSWEFTRRDYFMDFRGDVSDHVINSK
jgi:ketosteroid isomerase-like protein